MELMHLCINTLREETVEWKDGVERRELERKKMERLSTVVRKKAIAKEDQLQKKLLRGWMKLPEKEKNKYREDEAKRLRVDIANAKSNLHRWRSREGEARKEQLRKERKQQEKTTEEKVDEIEKTLARLEMEKKAEEERRRVELEERKMAREKLKTERERKEEERRKARDQRRRKLEKHKRIQEAWVNLRWVTKHLDENEEIWEIERLERQEERRRIEEEWSKYRRFEKISYLKEMRRKKESGERIDPDDTSWCWTQWRSTGDQILVENDWPREDLNFTFTEIDDQCNSEESAVLEENTLENDTLSCSLLLD